MIDKIFQKLSSVSITSEKNGQFKISLPTITTTVNSFDEIGEFFNKQPISVFVPLMFADIIIKNENDILFFKGQLHIIFSHGYERIQNLLFGSVVDIIDIKTGNRLNLTENLIELGIPELTVSTWVSNIEEQEQWLAWFFSCIENEQLILEIKTKSNEVCQIPIRIIDERNKENM